MEIAAQFAPFEKTASRLLPHALGSPADGAHDLSHILRVWRNVQAIQKYEGGDRELLMAATLLHDCVSVPKDSPQRSSASRLAAERASALLRDFGWPRERIAATAHAIEAHSFSARITPQSREARILQDADRLDAIGHIGIARCFYVSGRLGRSLYDPIDPAAMGRNLNDLAFALDHFETKLLKLAGSFQTEAGNRLAAERHETARAFREGLLAELGP